MTSKQYEVIAKVLNDKLQFLKSYNPRKDEVEELKARKNQTEKIILSFVEIKYENFDKKKFLKEVGLDI